MSGSVITLIETFNDSLGTLTGVDPIRYSNGLWLEEGTTNLFPNPISEISNASWGSGANATATRVTTGHLFGSASMQVVTPGSAVDERVQPQLNSSLTSPRTFTHSVYSKLASGSATLQLRAVHVYTDGSKGQNASCVVTTDWARMTPVTIAMDDPKTMSISYSIIGTGTIKQAVTFFVTGHQIEEKPYATSLAVGSFGPGYSWAATAHASPSTRAASSASISPAGILSPSSGALAFRITPTIETGVEEIWGECGVKGSGTEHVQWGRDSSKHPFVEWSANNAAYQRLTGSETLNALTAYDLYLGHSATTISLAVDAGTLQTGTRDAISDSWGAGDLTLKATAGGVVYNQFATFNRPLSASEIKTLDRRNSWSRTMFGNPFAYFQLRPY